MPVDEESAALDEDGIALDDTGSSELDAITALEDENTSALDALSVEEAAVEVAVLEDSTEADDETVTTISDESCVMTELEEMVALDAGDDDDSTCADDARLTALDDAVMNDEASPETPAVPDELVDPVLSPGVVVVQAAVMARPSSAGTRLMGILSTENGQARG